MRETLHVGKAVLFFAQSRPVRHAINMFDQCGVVITLREFRMQVVESYGVGTSQSRRRRTETLIDVFVGVSHREEPDDDFVKQTVFNQRFEIREDVSVLILSCTIVHLDKKPPRQPSSIPRSSQNPMDAFNYVIRTCVPFLCHGVEVQPVGHCMKDHTNQSYLKGMSPLSFCVGCKSR